MRTSRTLRIVFTGMIFLVLITLAFSSSAEHTMDTQVPPLYKPMYSYTDNVDASLSFNGDIAKCRGSIFPSEPLLVSVTVSLYKQVGSTWELLDSWEGHSTNGLKASASGQKAVGPGTYKVVTTGNVGGLEFPTASVTKTKP